MTPTDGILSWNGKEVGSATVLSAEPTTVGRARAEKVEIEIDCSDLMPGKIKPNGLRGLTLKADGTDYDLRGKIAMKDGWLTFRGARRRILPSPANAAAAPALVVTVACKPREGTFASNVKAWNTGGINVDATRVPMSTADADRIESGSREIRHDRKPGVSLQLSVKPMAVLPPVAHPKGRWTPNVMLEHKPACSEESCVDECPVADLDWQNPITKSKRSAGRNGKDTPVATFALQRKDDEARGHDDAGGVSRFFKKVGGRWCPAPEKSSTPLKAPPRRRAPIGFGSMGRFKK